MLLTGILRSTDLYAQDVGATTRDLLIDNTGLVGYQASTIEKKENVRDLADTSWIYNLRPVLFDWKTGFKDDWGLIAEEVDLVQKRIVTYSKDGKPEAVTLSRLIVPLLSEIQNLKKRIEVLEAK
jgi:hypothetical protein